jgi:hypothetical protein
MEPRQFEKSEESRGEVQASPPRPQERKRRFQIVKLEERIAPGHGYTTRPDECHFTRNPHCTPA